VINFFNEDIEFPDIDISSYIKWIGKIINQYNYTTGDINYIFCSNKYILQINKKYLNHNYFTDIITFNYNENNIINSDIFISIETVNENADCYNTTFYNELSRVIIHGILHLIGFDDKTKEDQAIMTQKENEALSLLSL
jgi:rRNA maturation RNase YbeY